MKGNYIINIEKNIIDNNEDGYDIYFDNNDFFVFNFYYYNKNILGNRKKEIKVYTSNNVNNVNNVNNNLYKYIVELKDLKVIINWIEKDIFDRNNKYIDLNENFTINENIYIRNGDVFKINDNKILKISKNSKVINYGTIVVGNNATIINEGIFENKGQIINSSQAYITETTINTNNDTVTVVFNEPVFKDKAGSRLDNLNFEFNQIDPGSVSINPAVTLISYPDNTNTKFELRIIAAAGMGDADGTEKIEVKFKTGQKIYNQFGIESTNDYKKIKINFFKYYLTTYN